MIRVLALYSQCKQQLDMSVESVIDGAAARRLATVLKTLLGLEATIELVSQIYVTIVEESELLTNPHKAKFDESAQSLSSVLAWKVLPYAE